MFRYVAVVLLLSAVVLLILTPHTQVELPTIIEWAIPTANSSPLSIFVSDGSVYFTEYWGNKIGRLDRRTGMFNEWTIPTRNSQPRGIFVSGNLIYFTEYAGNKIGCLDQSKGVFNEWIIPTGNSYPMGLAVSGNVGYFTEYAGNKIGCLTVSPVASVIVINPMVFSTVITVAVGSTVRRSNFHSKTETSVFESD